MIPPIDTPSRTIVARSTRFRKRRIRCPVWCTPRKAAVSSARSSQCPLAKRRVIASVRTVRGPIVIASLVKQPPHQPCSHIRREPSPQISPPQSSSNHPPPSFRRGEPIDDTAHRAAVDHARHGALQQRHGSGDHDDTGDDEYPSRQDGKNQADEPGENQDQSDDYGTYPPYHWIARGRRLCHHSDRSRHRISRSDAMKNAPAPPPR